MKLGAHLFLYPEDMQPATTNAVALITQLRYLSNIVSSAFKLRLHGFTQKKIGAKEYIS